MQNNNWFLRVLRIRPAVFWRGENRGTFKPIPGEPNNSDKKEWVAGLTIPGILIIIILLIGIPMCLLTMVTPAGESILADAFQVDASRDYAAIIPPISAQNPCSPATPVEGQVKSDKDYAILSASLSYQPGAPKTIFSQSTMAGSGGGREVEVEASVDVLGGGLTLTPPSDESDWSSGEDFVTQGNFQRVIPIFIITDSTGLGSGWHINVRSDHKQGVHAKLNCLNIALSNEDIEKLFGNQKPASLIILPTWLDHKDQVLAQAAPGEGMGKFAVAPMLSDMSAGVDGWRMETGRIVVNLIVSP